MQNPGRPPPVESELDPHDLPVERHPPGLAVVAVVVALGRRVQLEALEVEGGRTALATDQGPALVNRLDATVVVLRNL